MSITVRKCFLLIFFVSYSFLSFADDKITKIIVENNHRIESSTIIKYLNLKVGDKFNRKMEIDSIKNLYSTEFFDNISLNFNNGLLIVRVFETPMIISIEFKGNSKIKTDDLENLTAIYKGDSYHQSVIDKTISQITQLYNSVGRYLIKIDLEKVKLENNRVKLIFDISEGPKTKVRNIGFIGNNIFSSSILKKNIYTKETAWYSFLSSDDVYNPGRIEYDINSLKEFYHSNGYIDFKHISVVADLAKTKNYFNIIYNIDEGEQYKFGDASIKSEIEGIKIDSKTFLQPIKKGKNYDGNIVKRIVNNIANNLENEGYPEIDVSYDIDKNVKDRIININFVIKKSSHIYIEKINITGNRKTHDKVIRRELKIYEGDVFNKRLLDSGIRRIRNLGYFEPNITSSYTKNIEYIDRYNLNINVEEKSTAALVFSAGYSSVGGIFGTINYREINLGGTGKILELNYTRYPNTSNWSIGIIEPHIFDSNISLGGRIFKKSSTDSDFNNVKRPYSENAIGFEPRIGYEITNDLYHSISYLIQQSDIKLNKDTDKTIPKVIQEQAGERITSAIKSALTFDKLDNRYFPKNGYLLSTTQEFAGLGGDVNFFKNEFSGKFVHSFFEESLTFKLSGNLGNILPLKNKDLRIVDRFSLGEPRFRGFEVEGVGPRIVTPDDKGGIKKGESLGGDTYYLVNAELIFPIKNEKDMNISLVGFMDFGSVWGLDGIKDNTIKDSNSLRISTGFGIILNTALAPLRIDFGFPLKCEDYDKKQVVSFGSSISF